MMVSCLRNALLGVLIGTLMPVLDASAGIIILSDSDIIRPPGASGSASNPSEQEIIDAIVSNDGDGYKDVTDLGTLLYKWEQENGNDSELLSGSYDIIDLVDSGQLGGTITYTAPGDIFDPSKASWLVVKDGVAGWVVYDLDSTGAFGKNWNGIDNVVFTNAGLYNPNKNDGSLMAISNVQIWGYSTSVTTPPPGPPGAVPEPASLAIFGFGALGLGLAQLRRRRNVASTTV